MKKYLEENIKLIEQINSDDSNYIVRVYNNYNKEKNSLSEKMKKSKIIIENTKTNIEERVINLDEIETQKYFYTRMKLKFEKMIEKIAKVNKEEILLKKNKVCKQIIFCKSSKTLQNEEEKVDIVKIIKIMIKEKRKNPNDILKFKLIAKKIDDENVFKEEQLNQAINIINIDDIQQRNKKIYEIISKYLDIDFISKGYCDFKDNKCVAQRHARLLFPITQKNGCCFTRVRRCKNLQNKKCKVNCIACKLFSCPYLTKRGVGYYGSELILLQAFFSEKQRKHIIFDFYKSEEKILEKVNALNN